MPPHQTIGGPLENMAKFSEDFAAATWDKSGGSCSVSANAVIADGLAELMAANNRLGLCPNGFRVG